MATTTDELFTAISAGDDDAIEQLLHAEPSLLGASRDGISPVRAAAYAGRLEVAQRLEAMGAAPDAFDAAALGQVERLRELLDGDPDLVRAVAGDGFTALHLAAWFGHPEVAELLLSRGADPGSVATNGTGLQPLHSAAAGGSCVIAHLLLDRGADIDAAQTGGVRPLHSAAHRNDAAMVRLLLSRGADPTIATDDGRTALDLATDPEIQALLPRA